MCEFCEPAEVRIFREQLRIAVEALEIIRDAHSYESSIAEDALAQIEAVE